jgi:hypothetical protein
MFAFIWQTIRAMYHYPNDKYYIHFGRESCYFDEEMYSTQGINNVWDYYFEQPDIATKPALEEILSEIGLLHDDFSEFRDIYLTPEVYEARRREYAEVVSNNVRLLPHVSSKVEEFCSTHFRGKRVLGVHCRGTDHPDKLPIEFYIDRIATYIEDYDILFITSDEQNRLDAIKKAFPDKALDYPATFRSTNNIPLHYANNYECSKYYVGEDVIVEAYLLAKTDMLLCCTNSNVNYFVRILNTKLPYKILTNDTN